MKKLFLLLSILCTAAFTCAAASGKFKIQGEIDPAIAKSCKTVCITDLDAPLSDNSTFTCPVRDDRFFYETTLNGPKVGRIRIQDQNGELSPFWIDLTFMPDFTLRLTIRDGAYTIANIKEYNERLGRYLRDSNPSADNIRLNNATLVDAYGCEVPVNGRTVAIINGAKVINDPQKGTYLQTDRPARFETELPTFEDLPEDMKRSFMKAKLAKEVLQTKLDSYKEMLAYLKNLYDNTARYDARDEIQKKIQSIMDKMDKALEEYAATIK